MRTNLPLFIAAASCMVAGFAVSAPTPTPSVAPKSSAKAKPNAFVAPSPKPQTSPQAAPAPHLTPHHGAKNPEPGTNKSSGKDKWDTTKSTSKDGSHVIKGVPPHKIPVTPTPTVHPKKIKKIHPVIGPEPPPPNLKHDPNIIKAWPTFNIVVPPNPASTGDKKLVPPSGSEMPASDDTGAADSPAVPTSEPGSKAHVASKPGTPAEPKSKDAATTPAENKSEPSKSHVWLNIDVDPPSPSQLGAPIIIPKIPPSEAIPLSEVNLVADGMAPVPENYSPPPQDAPVEISPTALRAWNGQEKTEERAFDQTKVKAVAGDKGTAPWQFFWKSTGPAAQAARWEVAAVPFVDGFADFPAAGLVGYGDASVNVEGGVSENFFAVDFNTFSKNFAGGETPKKYYMRVVPVDQDGNTVGKASNFVRVDLPQ
jgi:hypothetical protein